MKQETIDKKTMTAERWQQIEKLFYSALDQPPGEMAEFLDQACASDAVLRSEVEALIATYNRSKSSDESGAENRGERGLDAIKVRLASQMVAETGPGKMIGRTLGRYRLLSHLGAGGMGEVYCALDTFLDRQVAVKILSPLLSASSESLRRFEREAKAVAALSHPNILAIHDFGTEQGVSYAVMELLKGETLRSRLAQGSLPWRKAVAIGVEMAEGLSAAHAKGITHRDLKPENIFLTLEGRTKILDFGLASVRPEIPAEHVTSAPTEPLITTPGSVMGTFGYMSPEQLRGEKADAPSDIFSFGSVLYEMITGRQAFRRETLWETNAAILRDDPLELTNSGKSTPAELQRVITHCLEKNPSERFQSARDLAFALREISINPKPIPISLSLRSWVMVAMAVLLIGAVLYLLIWSKNRENSGAIQAIAVLPFENQTGNPAEEYFADQVTGQLITNLGIIQSLSVISRDSAMNYKGTKKPVQEIARELNVDVVVKGTVHRLGDSVRIIPHLIRASTGQDFWNKTFERNSRDILALQSQMVLAIAQESHIRLTPQEQARLARAQAINNDAYQLYSQGLSYLETRDPDAIKKGRDLFNQAIAKEPNYAPYYAGLASSYILGSGVLSPTETNLIVKGSAMTALELDDTLAEAHACLASVRMLFDWNWLAAESEFKRAIELNPSYATAHQWYAEYLTAMGRHEDAFEEIKLATQKSPQSVIIQRDMGWHYYLTGRYDQAIAQLRNTVKMDPNSDHVHWLLGLAYAKKAMFADSIYEMQKAVDVNSSGNNLAALGYSYAIAGRKDEAQQTLNTLIGSPNKSPVSPFFIAAIYAELGEKDQAFSWLDKAYDEHSELLVYLNVVPIIDSLRTDQRFRTLTQKVGLPK